MFPFLEVIPLLITQLIEAILHPIFWLVIILVAFQYRRTLREKHRLFGFKHGRWWPDTLQAAGYGVLGGLIGSILMLFVGLTLTGSGLIYLWAVALLLMMINLRFLCFAYAGGILSLAHLLFGWPEISVPQVLALVAILHMVESILIYFSGHLGAVPSYFKMAGNRVVGGFVLQRFWPIPVVALLVIGVAELPPEGVPMPEWWPLIKPRVEGDPEMLLYGLIPVVAGLGYGDMATARKPQEKARLSAKYLAIYSLILLVLAVLSDQYLLMGLMAALFSFLGHEAVIYIGKKVEMTQQPIYVPPGQGVMVLDVLPKTPAWNAGLRSGDVILAVNDIPLYSKSTLQYMLHHNEGLLEFSYISSEQQAYRRELVKVPPAQPFGLLPVPEGGEGVHGEIKNSGLLSKWFEKWKKRFGAPH
ncbi:PDZ domain-containing protein [Desulfofalx alkaliphila]|uniref:PDZ domain-containing protein n=1 Tax=Desulfofalx alkaliphila TaxID=105483 RepID=UPI0004E0D124|nr:PDZ domain-containing protein [Desulfofalx alkaliphila]